MITRYAVRNALAPTVQALAATAQWLLGGVFVVETLFSYPGIGRALVVAVTVRDIPVIQAAALLIAAFYIALNIIADIAIVLLIPEAPDGAVVRTITLRIWIAFGIVVLAAALLGPFFAPHGPNDYTGGSFLGSSSQPPLRDRRGRSRRAEPGAVGRPQHHRARRRSHAPRLRRRRDHRPALRLPRRQSSTAR